MKAARWIGLIGVLGCSAAAPTVDPAPSSADVVAPPPSAGSPSVGIRHYALTATISPRDKTVTALARISLEAMPTGPVHLFLHRHFVVDDVQIDGRHTTAVEGNRTLPYVDVARHLVVANDAASPSVITLRYHGAIRTMVDAVNHISPDALELAAYAAWYPTLDQPRRYPFDLTVTLPAAFTIVSRGERLDDRVTDGQRTVRWRARQPGLDIPLFASADVSTVRADVEGVSIETHYRDLSRAEAARATEEAGASLAFYRSLFGPTDANTLQMIFSPRGGWGYSRYGYFIVSEQRHRQLLSGELEDDGPTDAAAHGNAHEIAHFWWNNADTATVDDWINEALAEYAAAIDSRRRLGEEGLGQWLERYRSSLETKPPPVGILGTSSGDSYRYANWYQRGALFFYCTEQRVGRSELWSLLRELARLPRITTSELRERLEPRVGHGWLVNWLESTSLEPIARCLDAG